jgi:hypothetical protein
MPAKNQEEGSQRQLAAFHEAVQSLKLYRRAELPGNEDDRSLTRLL